MQKILASFWLCLTLPFIVIGQSMAYQQVQDLEIVQERTNSQWAMEQEYVVMISIDGFRHDYAEQYGAKNIQKLASDGMYASKLLPAYPTKTFPNHYTLVTGLRPGNHGLVSNEFYSRQKDAWYKVRDKRAVQDSSWYGGKPLWVLAEEQGMLSANFFWVGSEAAICGVKSTYSYQYNGRIPNQHRIRKMLDWLGLPAEKRPHLLMGYFSLVDDAGHRYGPDHEKTGVAVLEIDRLIGVLQAGIDSLGLPVNIVLVSDHGMSAISHGIVLPDVVDLDDARVSYSFPPMIYQADPVKKEKLYSELLKVPYLSVYKQEAIPEYLSFVNPDRIGDLIILTDAPTIVLQKPEVVKGGTHGFDPYTHKEMGGLLCASGPGLNAGISFPPIENIHVYPFIAALLGLPINHSIDGNKAVLIEALK